MPVKAGGFGGPRAIGVVLAELQSGANTAFQMYPGLTHGAADLLETFGSPLYRGEQPGVGTWSPAVDIFETGDEIIVKAEVPGLAKDQIHVEVENGVLTLHGERKFEREVKEENYHRVERTYGAFHRSFSLPGSVDAEKVRAEMKDGILEVRLGKREQAKPKQITVAVK